MGPGPVCENDPAAYALASGHAAYVDQPLQTVCLWTLEGTSPTWVALHTELEC